MGEARAPSVTCTTAAAWSVWRCPPELRSERVTRATCSHGTGGMRSTCEVRRATVSTDSASTSSTVWTSVTAKYEDRLP